METLCEAVASKYELSKVFAKSGVYFNCDDTKLPPGLVVVAKGNNLFDVKTENIALCEDTSPTEALTMFALFTRVLNIKVEKANQKLKSILKY